MQLNKLLVSYLLATISMVSLESTAQDAQDASIKKAIAHQDEAFKNRDSVAWKASWLQDDKTSSIHTNIFSSEVKTGWKNVSEEALRYMKEHPIKDSVKISTDSFLIRREGNMAVADYYQKLEFPNAQPPFEKFTSREQRVLIKKKGKWLIASATSNSTSGLGVEGTELSLNATGYNFLFSGKNNEAIKVFELNSQLFPNSFNVWDSLGEAYAKAGNKVKAIECYEKSMALNPSNESGKKALAELK